MKHPKADIYWIQHEDQMRCLVSSLRQSIGDYLCTAGPRPARDIAHALGVKPSALYYHLDALMKVDLIQEVGTQQLNKKIEKLYDAPARSMRWGYSLLDPDNKALWQKVNAAQCRQSDRDFTRGLESRFAVEQGPHRNLRTLRLIGSPNKQARAQINKKVEEIAALMATDTSKPAKPENLLALSFVIAPVLKD